MFQIVANFALSIFPLSVRGILEENVIFLGSELLSISSDSHLCNSSRLSLLSSCKLIKICAISFSC